MRPSRLPDLTTATAKTTDCRKKTSAHAGPAPAAASGPSHTETGWIVSGQAATFPWIHQRWVQCSLDDWMEWTGCCRRNPILAMNPPVWSVSPQVGQGPWKREDGFPRTDLSCSVVQEESRCHLRKGLRTVAVVVVAGREVGS